MALYISTFWLSKPPLSEAVEPISTGIYWQSSEPQAKRLESAKGGPLIGVGRLLKANDFDLHIRSSDSLNKTFQATVVVNVPVPDGSTGPVLVVKSGTIRHFFMGIEEVERGRRIFGYEIGNLSTANEVAVLKPGCLVKLRKHPGHQLLFRCAPEKEVYHAGDRVFVKATIYNVGTLPVYLVKANNFAGKRSTIVAFLPELESGSNASRAVTTSKKEKGSVIEMVTVAAGEEISVSEELTQGVTLKGAGMFRFVGVWDLRLYENQIERNFNNQVWEETLACHFDIRLE